MYYNREGKPLKENPDEMEYLSCGDCATIYHDDDIIFKKYFSYALYRRLSTHMFDILKDIDNPHFIKLLDIYSEMTFLELVKHKLGLRRFVVDAYTAKYYRDDSVNPLYEPKSYILDNFNELEKLFAIFTSKRIIADDVKRKNAILSPNGIIIIDPDYFYLSKKPKQDIAFINKLELLNFFRSICTNNIKDYKNYKEFYNKITSDLTNIRIDAKTNVTRELARKLKNVKRPIDYLIK